MTDTRPSKPLAPHGTTARAKGRPALGIPGCGCPACRRAENRYDKRRRYLNATGRTLMVDTAPIAEHLRALFAAGAGWAQLSERTGCSHSTIHGILNGRHAKIRRTVADRITAVKPGEAIPPLRAVPATGSIRRVHALMALAHKCKDISAATGVEHSMIGNLVNERVDTVARTVADRITAGYERLAATTGVSARSRNRARREGWPPPAAWDDIDNPDAAPDWTGHCGTDHGWYMHRIEQLPMCGACQTAHEQWLADRAHLTPRERARAAFTARSRAAASGRHLADDARELFRQGYTREQAADRLGISRDHLGVVLARHPETSEAAA